ncbi:MAG: phage scaffolding protein, partial [Oscillospiraceae bacterium]|nr:phage scaffolding protein [Oscillospiraceae bacterium]
MQFSHRLETAIRAANGRNEKAICALLDMDVLQKGGEKEIAEAVEKLRGEAPYLFESKELPPLFARGTGAASPLREEEPVTLAGALKQRFMKERK